MTTHTFTATATDTMGATDTDTDTINSTSSAPMRVVKRSFMENRYLWGSAIDTTPRGPYFSDQVVLTSGPYDFYQGRTCPPDDMTVSMIFQVMIPVRFTGLKVYKAPNHVAATGVPFTLWQSSTLVTNQASTGTVLGTVTSGAWVADDGGWRQIDFASPITLIPGVSYVLGMYAEDGIYSFTPWVWHAQETCVWPLYNKHLGETTVAGRFDGTANSSFYSVAPDGGILFPRYHGAHNYYLDPMVEWEEPRPNGFNGDATYWDQWTTPVSRHAFPVAIWFSDPPFINEYFDMGVNTLFAGYPHLAGYENSQLYFDAMAATGTGHEMDWWVAVGQDLVSITFNPIVSLVQLMADNPGLADQVVGYSLWDEPDMQGTYRTPEVMRGWFNQIRERDSTRPIHCNFGRGPARNQGFYFAPSGAQHLQMNVLWREWSELTDFVSCDDYQFFEDNNAWGVGGVWAYANQVGRMREVSDDRKPVWAVIETTTQAATPLDPDLVLKSTWAALIAGARGILFFDHRWANSYVTQDFAHMLHNPPMKAAVTALCAQLQTLGPALLSPDIGLVTAYTTSNKTEGPMGGTFGVPIHYTTRDDGTNQYLFAQAIRPGDTTATFTIPAWASETLDVLDESRTITVSSGGVLTDDFDADYTTHLYRL